jgi:hypothetical protein
MAVAATHNDHVSIGAHANVLIMIWFQSPTMEDFGLVESATTDLIERTPSGIGLLIVVAEGADKPPPQDVRRRNAELVARYEGKIWGQARVIEGTGVKMGMLRFVFSTIDLLSNSALKETTVESVADAAAWLCGLKPNLHERAIVSDVDRLRRGAPGAKAAERQTARPR